MEFLRFLEGLRTPFLDTVFSALTMLGEETVFILAGLLFFWCVDKTKGYYVLAVGFAGTILNQFLKLLFRIPRPWVRDENFTIVESAREEATGYSFPSGHTQSSVGVFGSVARMYRKAAVRIVCVAACVLVPLSRMYLGVHTPADVIVSIVIALALVFGLYPLIGYAVRKPSRMRVLFGGMSALALAFLVFVLVFPFPVDIDPDNYESGLKNGFKILGCVLGLWLSYEVDYRFIRFETKAVWWVQILKLVLGLIPVLLVKEGLRAPLNALCGGYVAADGIRYFLIVLVAGCVWPLTFRWFAKLGGKKSQESGTTPCVSEEIGV